MWKPVAKWLALVALAAYVVCMFVWARAEAKRHSCTGIEVAIEGPGQVGTITEEGVKEVLRDYPHPIAGQPVHTINTYEIANFLRSFNNFETVDCLITTKGSLLVKVAPMKPALRVFAGDDSYYVNKDGKTMAAIPGFHVDVPVVAGNFSKDFPPQALMPVVRFIQTDPVIDDLVEMIQVKDKNNILLVPRIKGHVINIGDTADLDVKRRAILTAYRQILPRRGWETYDTISVKYKGQIVATRRDKKPLFPMPDWADIDDGEEAALEAAELDTLPQLKPKKPNG